ncbi:MAG TPA: hypothetical protein DDY20_07500 [Desulfobulbaceae bacterium]|nr:hypothetical protein [Desulfobulbaceae bacterium]
MTANGDDFEKEVAALRKMNQVLIARVEHAINSSGSDYSIFEQNILLQNRVEERTNELEESNRRLAEYLKEEKRISEDLRASERRAALQRAAIAQLVLDQSIVSGDQPRALERITEILAATIDVARASVWKLSEDQTEFHCLTLYLARANSHQSCATIFQTNMFPRYFEAVLAGNRINAEDALNDPRTRELAESYLLPLGITSMLDSGIFKEGRLIGIICLEHTGPRRKWHADEESFISTAATIVAQLFLNEERRRAEERLRESEERFRILIKNSSDFMAIISVDGILRYISPAAERASGFSIAELKGKALRDIIHPDDIKDVMAVWNEAVRHPEKVFSVQYRHIHKTREWVYFEAIGQSCLAEPAINGVVASVRDITERRHAEQEKEKLHEQLAQAHKMESVGLLAGGVAHDFNNMLGVILGHAELAMAMTGSSGPIYKNLEEIRRAANRSTDITRQLLAFARKQTVVPQVIDLNETIAQMLKMIRRFIGEDIDLVWLPKSGLWPVKIDPSQIDQILINLCANARDAIVDLGKVTIETDSAVFDKVYCTAHPDFLPGEFVLLAISDNGCGMGQETLSHLFEPFFTTKKMGKGTGLGLAMVYGIVKQNNGFINVSSKPNQGTTFKIYLPRHTGEAALKSKANIVGVAETGHETILLVEDEPMILEIAKEMIEKQGYSVLTASTPGEAIRLARQHTGEIHLLITDVIMPDMNGRDLARNLQPLCPGLRYLFMSGYTANVIAQHGVLDEGIHFIQKPFTMKDLATRIRDVLSQTNP